MKSSSRYFKAVLGAATLLFISTMGYAARDQYVPTNLPLNTPSDSSLTTPLNASSGVMIVVPHEETTLIYVRTAGPGKPLDRVRAAPGETVVVAEGILEKAEFMDKTGHVQTVTFNKQIHVGEKFSIFKTSLLPNSNNEHKLAKTKPIVKYELVLG